MVTYCSCASRRDVKLDKKMGRQKARSNSGELQPHETRQRERRGKVGLFGP